MDAGTGADGSIWDVADGGPPAVPAMPWVPPGPPANRGSQAAAVAATLFQAVSVCAFLLLLTDLPHADGSHPLRLAADAVAFVLLVAIPLVGGIRRVRDARDGDPMPGRVFLSMFLAGGAGLGVALLLRGSLWLSGADGGMHAFGEYSLHDAVLLAGLVLGTATVCLMLIVFDVTLGAWMTFRGAPRPYRGNIANV